MFKKYLGIIKNAAIKALHFFIRELAADISRM
jgi:hypothetical protein